MTIKPYCNDELWKPDKYHLPQRSRLNHLPVIRIETSVLESLTSYITRLAESHSISISVLMTRELAPLLNKHYIQNGITKGLSTLLNRGAALNSMGELAQKLVDSLEKLTLQRNLAALTLLPIGDFLSSRELLHKTKAWCPFCYEEWKTSNNKIYEPLLWTLKDVKFCSRHYQPLQTICPYCDHEVPRLQRDRQIPWLSSKSRIGYCSHCDRWLGSSINCKNTANTVFSEEDLSRNIWISLTLGELIVWSSKSSNVTQKVNIREAVQKIIDITHQGNIAAFARAFKLPKNTVWMWYHGKSSPNLKYILNICYCLDISLLNFINLEETAFQSLKINPQKLSNQSRIKRVSPRNFDSREIELSLQTILNSQQTPPPTMREVAEKLGFDRRTISDHYPELCKAISARYFYYQRLIRAKKIEDCCKQVREAVIFLVKRGEYPSEVRVSDLISQPGYFRYKKVRMALRDAKSNLNFQA